jgi:flagellar export protein FliJ
MKKYSFPLGRIRDYKEQLLDREKNILARLNNEKNQHLARIEQILLDYISIDNEMKAEYRKGTNINKIQIFAYRKDAIKTEEKQIKERIKILDKAIEKQRKIVIGISQEVEGYNKLEEKTREEYNEILKKETENTLGEFISTKLGAVSENTDDI